MIILLEELELHNSFKVEASIILKDWIVSLYLLFCRGDESMSRVYKMEYCDGRKADQRSWSSNRYGRYGWAEHHFII